VAFLGAAVMVGAGQWLGFYSQEQAVETIDFNTLGVLLGMMIIVSLLEPTGFFQYVAVQAGRMSKGNPVRLLIILGTFTTLLSMFLDNVTTVVLIAPVTILISEIMGINPIPLLMAEALLSDTGGAATLIGDPPNILIGSAADLSFLDFLTHALPVVLVAWLGALFLLRYLFRVNLHDASISIDAVLKLDPKQTLKDPASVRKVLIVLGGALVMFLVHGALGLSPSYVAMSAAAIALVVVRPPVQETLQRVDWSVLLFFAALFVIVGGLEAAGVLEELADNLGQMAGLHPILFGLALIWLVAILSAVVDNVPITIALIPVIEGLGGAGMNTAPLWWALVFGAGFGGNGTIIGSTANIVVAGISEKTRTPITARMWNRYGLPVMLVTLSITSILYVLAYPLFRGP
jgi:Na+/H+ antiporter NhaD/arsenite permease-like protein